MTIRACQPNGEIIVSDFAHDVKACALGQAASSIMARNVIGASADELRELRQTIEAMLREEGAPPTGKFEEFKVLEPVRDYKARHTSTLLTFNAVVDCLDQIEQAGEQANGFDANGPDANGSEAEA